MRLSSIVGVLRPIEAGDWLTFGRLWHCRWTGTPEDEITDEQAMAAYEEIPSHCRKNRQTNTDRVPITLCRRRKADASTTSGRIR